MQSTTSWLGYVEKIAAKTLLAQIELDLRFEGRRRQVAPKSLKAVKGRRDDSNKGSTTGNTRQFQKVNSRNIPLQKIKSRELTESNVTKSTSAKQLAFEHQENSKLSKPLSKECLSKGGNQCNAVQDRGRKAVDIKNRRENTLKHLKELASKSVDRLANNAINTNVQIHGKQLLASSVLLKDDKKAKPLAKEDKNEQILQIKSRKDYLNDCKPVRIIPPCPNISEFGSKINLNLKTKRVLPKVVTKAKSSIELPYRSNEQIEIPVKPEKVESKSDLQPKPLAKPVVLEQPKAGTTVAREVPKKWKGGTHISTTTIGTRKIPPRLQRPWVPRVRSHPPAPPNLDIGSNKLCSSYSIVQLMLLMEDALNSERHNPLDKSRAEHLSNKFKDELNKVLIFPEYQIPEKNTKSSASKSKTTNTNKKIRISECSDVRGFMEMLAGTREYNFKTKSTVQHKPAESPWLNILLPKEECDNINNEKPQQKVIVIPEVDPMNEIVEACVEKELKRCDGFANVKKAKCKDFTKEKVLLTYEQSAIEKYSPFNDSEQISDLFVQYGLPFILNSGNKLGITLSATEVNQKSRTKTLRYLPPPPDTPCTPMSEKLMKVTKTLKKKRNKKYKNTHINKKKKRQTHKARGHKIVCKKSKLMQELQKQIDSTPPYIFDRDKSLTDIHFEKEPKTYINLSEAANILDTNENDDNGDAEFYLADFVIDRNNPNHTYAFRMRQEDPKNLSVDVQQVISALGKAQDILLKVPSDILNYNNTLNISAEHRGREVDSNINGISENNIEAGGKGNTNGLQANVGKLSSGGKLNENTHSVALKSKNTDEEELKSCLESDETVAKSNEGNNHETSMVFTGNDHDTCNSLNPCFEQDNSRTYTDNNNNKIHEIAEGSIENDANNSSNISTEKSISKSYDNGSFQCRVEIKEETIEEIDCMIPLEIKSANKASEEVGVFVNEESYGEILGNEFEVEDTNLSQLKGVIFIQEDVLEESFECKNNELVLTTSTLDSKNRDLTKKRVQIQEQDIGSMLERIHTLSLNFLWNKRIFVSPKTGKMIGYKMKQYMCIKVSMAALQQAASYYQITKEGMETIYYSESKDNIFSGIDLCNEERDLHFIKDIVKSVSLNTIQRNRRSSARVNQPLFVHSFHVAIYQPFSSVFQNTPLHDKLKSYAGLSSDPLYDKLKSYIYLSSDPLSENTSENLKCQSFPPLSDPCFNYENETEYKLIKYIYKLSNLTSVDRTTFILFLKVFSHTYLLKSPSISAKEINFQEFETDAARLVLKIENLIQWSRKTYNYNQSLYQNKTTVNNVIGRTEGSNRWFELFFNVVLFVTWFFFASRMVTLFV